MRLLNIFFLTPRTYIYPLFRIIHVTWAKNYVMLIPYLRAFLTYPYISTLPFLTSLVRTLYTYWTSLILYSLKMLTLWWKDNVSSMRIEVTVNTLKEELRKQL